MKTKLLKKVRKRFSILDYPNGYKDAGGEIWPTMFTVTEDGDPMLFPYDTDVPMRHPENDTKEQAFDKAYKFLTEIIHKRYAETRKRPKKTTAKENPYPIEKVWPPTNAFAEGKFKAETAIRDWCRAATR